jgi:hypothetical protein
MVVTEKRARARLAMEGEAARMLVTEKRARARLAADGDTA